MLFLLFFSSLALTASLPSTLDIVTKPNISNSSTGILRTPSANNVSDMDDDIWSWQCTKSLRWTLPAVDLDDCKGMLDYFHYEAVSESGADIREFRAPEATHQSRYRFPQWTPRKYTFGGFRFFSVSGVVFLYLSVLLSVFSDLYFAFSLFSLLLRKLILFHRHVHILLGLFAQAFRFYSKCGLI